MGEPARTPAEVLDEFFGPALFTPGAQMLIEDAAPQPGERVLDLACGTGTLVRHVAPLVGPRGSVVGLDINPGMLAVAQARTTLDGTRVEWREGDAAALHLADRSFDLILCQQGVQYFTDRSSAASEMRRVLRPGGRVVLNVWQALHLHPVYAALCEAEARFLGVSLDEVTAPWSFPHAGDLETLLREAGFERVTVTSRSFEAHFPSPDRFVNLTLYGAVAFLPEFNWDDEALRQLLIKTVTREIEPVLARYRQGNRLRFPVFWHVAAAHA